MNVQLIVNKQTKKTGYHLNKVADYLFIYFKNLQGKKMLLAKIFEKCPAFSPHDVITYTGVLLSRLLHEWLDQV